jgi:hypothetical protein
LVISFYTNVKEDNANIFFGKKNENNFNINKTTMNCDDKAIDTMSNLLAMVEKGEITQEQFLDASDKMMCEYIATWGKDEVNECLRLVDKDAGCVKNTPIREALVKRSAELKK